MSSEIFGLATLLLIQLDVGQEEFDRKIEVLLKQLRSDRIEDRDGAASELKKLDPRAIPTLRATVDSLEPEARSRIREVIDVLETTKVLSPGLRRAFPGLAERLSKGPPHVWTEVFLSIWDLRSARSVQSEDLDCLVVRAFREARAGAEQVQLCDALAASPLPSATPILIDLLASDLETVSDAARTATVASKSSEALTRSEVLLKDARPWVRSNAVAVLENLGTKSHVTLLTPLLSDTSSKVRLAAGKAVSRFDKARAVSLLTASLSHPEPSFRRDAVVSLGEIGATQSTSAIVEILRDPDTEVRAAALKALVRLDARGAGTGISSLVEDSDLHVRICALQAVRGLALEEAYPRLLALLRQGKKGDDLTLSLAAEGIVELKGKRCLSDVAEILRTGSATGKLHAIRLICQLEAMDLGPDLIQALKCDDSGVVSGAALALGELQIRTGVEELRKLLASRDPGLRATAAIVLSRLGDREVVDELVGLLKDKEQGVRVQAALALASLGRNEGMAILIGPNSMPCDLSLLCLSALRSPVAWRKAGSIELARGKLGGGLEQIAKQFAQALGVSLAVDSPLTAADDSRWREETQLTHGGGKKCVLDLLQDAVQGTDYDFILEDGKLRLLHRNDAFTEWKAWWASTQGE